MNKIKQLEEAVEGLKIKIQVLVLILMTISILDSKSKQNSFHSN